MTTHTDTYAPPRTHAPRPDQLGPDQTSKVQTRYNRAQTRYNRVQTRPAGSTPDPTWPQTYGSRPRASPGEVASAHATGRPVSIPNVFVYRYLLHVVTAVNGVIDFLPAVRKLCRDKQKAHKKKLNHKNKADRNDQGPLGLFTRTAKENTKNT